MLRLDRCLVFDRVVLFIQELGSPSDQSLSMLLLGCHAEGLCKVVIFLIDIHTNANKCLVDCVVCACIDTHWHDLIAHRSVRVPVA